MFCFVLLWVFGWLVGWLLGEECVFEYMWPFCEEKNCAVSDLDGGVK